MTVHSSDLSDMHRQAANIAGVLDRLIAAKGNMMHTLTEHVAELERDLYKIA